jgi:hypothetical protein
MVVASRARRLGQMDAEYVKCPTCGMGWFTRRLCGHCAFRREPDPDCSECGGNVEYGLTGAHECPEPYDYETARFIAGTPCVVSPTTAARVRLGLARGPR